MSEKSRREDEGLDESGSQVIWKVGWQQLSEIESGG
jgi:hypothetical protein